MAPVDIEGLGTSQTSGTTVGPDFLSDDMVIPLQQLMPSGPIWNRTEGSLMGDFAQAVSYSFARILRRGIDLLNEADPQTTEQLIDDWETAMGLPDDCFTPVTTQDRRDAIITLLQGYGAPNQTLIEELATSAGFSIVLIDTSYGPFRVGLNQVGDRLYGEEWFYRFDVFVSLENQESIDLLQCRLDDVAHVHTCGFVRFWQNIEFSEFSGNLYSSASDGSGNWVIGASSALLASSSDDGNTWLEETPAGSPTGLWDAATYGEGLFVVASSGVTSQVQTSPNGSSWTSRSFDATFGFFCHDLAYSVNEGTFVAVGYNTSIPAAEFQASTNGTTWTQEGLAAGSQQLYGVVHDESGLWCAVGSNGIIYTTPTSTTTWTSRTNDGGYTGIFRSVAHSGSNFVAVGSSGEIQTSPDGITWTARTAAGSFTGTFYGVSSNRSGVVVAVGSNTEIQISRNHGVTWAQMTLPLDNYDDNLNSISYSSGTWVIVGNTRKILLNR